MKKSDIERLKKIVALWAALRLQIRERPIIKESLLTDEFLQWAVTTPLYHIGEQVYSLSPELKQQYPDIPWSVYPGFVTDLFITMRESIGPLLSISSMRKWMISYSLSQT